MQMLLESQRVQQEIGAASLQEQRKANHLKEQELQQVPRTKPKAADVIPKLGVTDDVEAYLHAFEATAARVEWPKTQWVGLLAPVRHLKLVAACMDGDYDQLKAEILSRYGLTRFSRAQRFHSWTLQNGLTPRSQMHE